MFRRRTTAAEPLPAVRARLDVQADGLDEALRATVLAVDATTLQVTAGRTPTGRGVRLEPGTSLTFTWSDDTALLSLPGQLVATRLGEEPYWEVRVRGAVRRVQRREAVRAAVRLQVGVNAGGPPRTGTTIDLSEGGARLVLDRPPVDEEGEPVRAAGDRMLITLRHGEQTITGEAELVRRHRRADDRWEASVEFTRLTDRQRDALRRLVFAELRDAEDS